MSTNRCKPVIFAKHVSLLAFMLWSLLVSTLDPEKSICTMYLSGLWSKCFRALHGPLISNPVSRMPHPTVLTATAAASQFRGPRHQPYKVIMNFSAIGGDVLASRSETAGRLPRDFYIKGSASCGRGLATVFVYVMCDMYHATAHINDLSHEPFQTERDQGPLKV